MKLFVGGLAYATTDDELNEYFSKIGKVESAVIIKDRNYDNRSKGFGFVEYGNDDDAKKAIEELNDKEFMGRTIVVSEAHDKKPNDGFRSSRGGNGGGHSNYGGGSRGGNNVGSFRRRSY